VALATKVAIFANEAWFYTVAGVAKKQVYTFFKNKVCR